MYFEKVLPKGELPNHILKPCFGEHPSLQNPGWGNAKVLFLSLIQSDHTALKKLWEKYGSLWDLGKNMGEIWESENNMGEIWEIYEKYGKCEKTIWEKYGGTSSSM